MVVNPAAAGRQLADDPMSSGWVGEVSAGWLHHDVSAGARTVIDPVIAIVGRPVDHLGPVASWQIRDFMARIVGRNRVRRSVIIGIDAARERDNANNPEAAKD